MALRTIFDWEYFIILSNRSEFIKDVNIPILKEYGKHWKFISKDSLDSEVLKHDAPFILDPKSNKKFSIPFKDRRMYWNSYKLLPKSFLEEFWTKPSWGGFHEGFTMDKKTCQYILKYLRDETKANVIYNAKNAIEEAFFHTLSINGDGTFMPLMSETGQVLVEDFKNGKYVLGADVKLNAGKHKHKEDYVKKFSYNRKPTPSQKPLKNIFCISYSHEVSIEFDCEPRFDLIVVNYSNKGSENKFPHDCNHEIHVNTECKGDLMLSALNFVNLNYQNYSRVCVFDDDITIKVSQINKLFSTAEQHSLDQFAPSLTKDSFYSHVHTLCHNKGVRKVDWVEVMMPGFSKKFVDKMLPLYNDLYNTYNLKSSWGLDIHVFTRVNSSINGSCAVIDDIIVKHHRRISSGGMRFSNGRSAREEMWLIRNKINEFSKKHLSKKPESKPKPNPPKPPSAKQKLN